VSRNKKNNPPSSLAWTKKYIWNDKGDGATLYNAKGDLISYAKEFPHGKDLVRLAIDPPKSTHS